ncbi:uncharacterized protein LOC135160244 [Diachasmimorpha longicaudata]|uniref:uncharacterized protein LOC135160244 n=1 Tax=Diachasmimorpha longicaudata TaxID=58733 RepID=UPI0030B8F107
MDTGLVKIVLWSHFARIFLPLHVEYFSGINWLIIFGDIYHLFTCLPSASPRNTRPTSQSRRISSLSFRRKSYGGLSRFLFISNILIVEHKYRRLSVRDKKSLATILLLL